MGKGSDVTNSDPPATASSEQNVVNQTILFPARTEDYVVKKGKNGLGLYAARDIRKGEPVFPDSLEFSYADVVTGDDILLSNDVLKCGRRRKTANGIPARIPSTPDMLNRTHGVEYLMPDATGKYAGHAVPMLEVPGMLMNHHCDASIITQEWGSNPIDIATRDIKKGEELTDNYILHEDEDGAEFECNCGAPNCRGNTTLFEDLDESQKERLLAHVTDVKRADMEAEAGRGPPVDWDPPSFPPRVDSGVPRLVFPGPSCAGTGVVAVRQDECGHLGLYAMKDIGAGEVVYEFWRQDWPLLDDDGNPSTFDMVFAAPHGAGDPPEGTVVRFDPLECGAARDRDGKLQFSGWDMLAVHCCGPNMVYNDVDEDEDDNWRATYAVRDIKEGELLTVDYNCIHWDRGESKNARDCSCGIVTCSGTNNGFKYLPHDAQEERKMMSWKRVPRPHDDEKSVFPGEALSPHIRVSWRKDEDQKDNAPVTDTSSSSSSSEDMDSDSDDDDLSSDEE